MQRREARSGYHRPSSYAAPFVLGASKASRSRASLILVEQVVTTLSACVLTFSELDVFVQALDSEQKMGILDRMKWIIKSNALKELLERLQQHKLSLNLMLTILTWYVNCTSMPLLVPSLKPRTIIRRRTLTVRL